MKQALIIFNGIDFPHHLSEHAMAWAKEQSASLHALFLAGSESEEGYAFPSDLDAAQNETDKQDAEQADLRVIRSQMKLVKDSAEADGIQCDTDLMVDPSLDDVLSRTKGMDIVFVDADFEYTGMMGVTGFSMKELIDKLPSEVERVSEKE